MESSKQIFNRLELPNGFACNDCVECIKESDTFNTGDSPESIECGIGCVSDCPEVIAERNNLIEQLTYEVESAE